MKKLATFFLSIVLCGALASPLPTVRSQSREQAVTQDKVGSAPTGKIIDSYRKGASFIQPDWVAAALTRSLTAVMQDKDSLGIVDAATELDLLSADKDDLGMTHVRLDQLFRGVPVFGGQLITHLDGRDERFMDGRKHDFSGGRVFPDARSVNTVPKITGSAAIATAIAALGYKGDFSREPQAELVILPEAIKKGDDTPGASLTYKIELFVNNGKEAIWRIYFVNAQNGNIEWEYSNLQTGTGNSQYSGVKNIGTVFGGSTYQMRDPNRSGQEQCGVPGIITSDFAGGNVCAPFTDSDDIWGDGTNANRQTSGVDAHFGTELTYDYYRNQHGRSSFNGSNRQILNVAHNNGSGVDNAFWDGNSLTLNFGDGSQGRSWTSVDVVGHEFTHGVTQFTANLTYANQSGGSNESFSDIFGTMVEYYSGINPDYTIGEDVNGGVRSMSNPRADGRSIDHFSQYYDGLDVHYSSGLQNVAFYLLAEGGTHPSSGVNVKRILRGNAANVYYRALAVYLTSSARFSDVRAACEQSARDLYQAGNPMYQAVQRSWYSAGVGANVAVNPIDDARNFVRQQYLDFLLREPDQAGWDYWTGQITQCGNDAECEDRKRVDVSRAFFYSTQFQQQQRAAGLVNPYPPPDFISRKFVQLCYLVYLQRPADAAGEDYWTTVLDQDIQAGRGYDHVVRAFIVSGGYRQRFGPM